MSDARAAVADQVVARLWALWREVAVQAAVSVDMADLEDQLQTGLEVDRQAIELLEGELLDRATRPGAFSQGLVGDAAWQHWLELADTTGQHLAMLLGAVEKWDLSSTVGEQLARLGRGAAEVAASSRSALPWVAIGLVALVFLTWKGRA